MKSLHGRHLTELDYAKGLHGTKGNDIFFKWIEEDKYTVTYVMPAREI